MEVERLEAVAAERRAKLNRMKQVERKAMAKLRKLERKISKIRNANRLAATNNARIQLSIDAILHLLDGNSLVSFDENNFHLIILFFIFFILFAD